MLKDAKHKIVEEIQSEISEKIEVGLSIDDYLGLDASPNSTIGQFGKDLARGGYVIGPQGGDPQRVEADRKQSVLDNLQSMLGEKYDHLKLATIGNIQLMGRPVETVGYGDIHSMAGLEPVREDQGPEIGERGQIVGGGIVLNLVGGEVHVSIDVPIKLNLAELLFFADSEIEQEVVMAVKDEESNSLTGFRMVVEYTASDASPIVTCALIAED